MQGIEGNECVPEALDIEETGDETYSPGKSHDESQPDVEPEVSLGVATGGESGGGSRGEDHVGAGGEEGDVEDHHQSQRNCEEHQQGVSAAEPAVSEAESRTKIRHHGT